MHWATGRVTRCLLLCSCSPIDPPRRARRLVHCTVDYTSPAALNSLSLMTDVGGRVPTSIAGPLCRAWVLLYAGVSHLTPYRRRLSKGADGVASFSVCAQSSKDVCFHCTAIRRQRYRRWYRLQYCRYRYHTDTAGIGRYPIPSTGIGLSLQIAHYSAVPHSK